MAGNDSVNFTADADGSVVYGQGGNDSLGITVSFNTSTMSGGAGNDTIFVTKGASGCADGDLGADSIYFTTAVSITPPFTVAINLTPLLLMVLTPFTSAVLLVPVLRPRQWW